MNIADTLAETPVSSLDLSRYVTVTPQTPVRDWFCLAYRRRENWHSSGLTTVVCGALKEGLKDREHDLGLYLAGGKGKSEFARFPLSEDNEVVSQILAIEDYDFPRLDATLGIEPNR